MQIRNPSPQSRIQIPTVRPICRAVFIVRIAASRLVVLRSGIFALAISAICAGDLPTFSRSACRNLGIPAAFFKDGRWHLGLEGKRTIRHIDHHRYLQIDPSRRFELNALQNSADIDTVLWPTPGPSVAPFVYLLCHNS
jgi:hypothetical protein